MSRGLFRRNPDYFKLWVSLSVSSFGDVLLTIWSVAYVAQQSDSSLLVALVFLSAVVPDLVFALVSGSVADYFDSRKVLSISAVMQALVLLPLIYGILYYEEGLVAIIIAVNFVQSIANTLYDSSIMVLLPQSVESADIQQANGRIRMSSQICGILGYAAGGCLLSSINGAAIVAVDIATFLVVAVIAFMLKVVPVSEPDKSPSLRYMLKGLKHIASNDRLRTLLLWAFFQGITITPIAIAIPAVVKQMNPDNPMLLGWHFALLSVGSLLSSIVVSVWTVKRYKEVLFICGLVIGLSVFILAWSPNPFLTLPACVVFGAAALFCMVIIFSQVQKNTPHHLMGRVCAGFNLAIQSVIPPLYLLIGVLSEYIPMDRILYASLAGGFISMAILVFKGGALAHEECAEEAPQAGG